ncbi:A disintegrin and metalloproteinase with thrombospondin motifs 9 [Homalodisca vitripennis]|nr:A disintegrin and metalloproteinase with thrombospondin motifs 9 [Homalodisca vitripennis]
MVRQCGAVKASLQYIYSDKRYVVLWRLDCSGSAVRLKPVCSTHTAIRCDCVLTVCVKRYVVLWRLDCSGSAVRLKPVCSTYTAIRCDCVLTVCVKRYVVFDTAIDKVLSLLRGRYSSRYIGMLVGGEKSYGIVEGGGYELAAGGGAVVVTDDAACCGHVVNRPPQPLLRHHSGHFRHKMAAIWDPHPQYEFSAFGQVFHLQLAHDSGFVLPDIKVSAAGCGPLTDEAARVKEQAARARHLCERGVPNTHVTGTCDVTMVPGQSDLLRLWTWSSSSI